VANNYAKFSKTLKKGFSFDMARVANCSRPLATFVSIFLFVCLSVLDTNQYRTF